MGRLMYVDGFSGAAGDMLLGALLDAGLPEEALRQALGSLGVGHELRVTRVQRAGVSALHVQVIEASGQHGHAQAHDHTHPHAHPHTAGSEHRSLLEIAQLIDSSALSSAGKDRAKALFRRLAEAEAAIHQTSLDQVHLHEVGATDSIIDILGVVFAMEWFGIDDVVAAPLNVGGGTVRIAHGTFPVPAPATLRLLVGAPIYNGGPDVELVTPTGALLVTAYARAFGPVPPMTTTAIGYGAGTRDLPGRPNVLRVLVGDRRDGAQAAEVPPAGPVVQIECEIDDMNPQLVPVVSERLLEAGALDAFATPIVMKKGRPGLLLTVLAPAALRDALTTVLFRETTTIGVRFHDVARETLDRHWVEVAVPGGVVRVKVAGRGGEVLNAAPEFDDCVRVARESGQPVKTVQAAALRAWHELSSGGDRQTR